MEPRAVVRACSMGIVRGPPLALGVGGTTGGAAQKGCARRTRVNTPLRGQREIGIVWWRE